MKVDLSADWIRDDEPHGAPVECLDKAGVGEGRDDGRFLVLSVHEVQITVLAGLLTYEGIDAPATADPGVDVSLP